MKPPADTSWIELDEERSGEELRGMLWFLLLALLMVVIAAAIVLGAAGLTIYALVAM